MRVMDIVMHDVLMCWLCVSSCWLGVAVIAAPPDVCVHALNDFGLRAKWDDMFSHGKLVEQVDFWTSMLPSCLVVCCSSLLLPCCAQLFCRRARLDIRVVRGVGA